ncbi:MAG: phosphoglycerate mutase (2,3-diphosphoglycerate-independent) [Deltaproteobacteria bacterium]|nr:MAG: phosphoglycerate mutase (2,3-diphosphoglycerate-independent) [Pseudomonadota bacterium]PIE66309.1 MAG: phosphoglycerate mutase (2,3-diphosphoglycerate-independent) [Deltaproteobacteria bacterium]
MSDWTLEKNEFKPRKGPVLLVVMDGVGIGREDEGNAVHLARTPVLDGLWRDHPTTQLAAHGLAVGLPSDADMGNSEVGHNALGAGRVFDQGAKLVDNAIEDGSLYAGEVWQSIVSRCREESSRKLHFIGLLSDGNVHSHIDQLALMLRRAAADGVEQVCVHPLLDGRDVGPQTSQVYIEQLEGLLSELSQDGRDYRIASGGGRMLVTMDRYEADWAIVERGWKAHVLGQGRGFESAMAAIEAYRVEDPQVSDQFLGAFVVTRGGKPAGTVDDGDAVVFFNFRGDRAIEITRAFEEAEFDEFDRQRVPEVLYAGMMQYDGDLRLPKQFLVPPPAISRTMGEYLAKNGIRQFACAETQKFGHVTYFWNGNRSGYFDEATERYVQCESDRVPFEQRPWMKAAEVTDATISALQSGEFAFLRVNYANGDMVGHTGDVEASITAMQVVDLCLGRLLEVVEKVGGIALITADHGNSDEMFEWDTKGKTFAKNPDGSYRSKTSHTLNPVPLTIFDPSFDGEYALNSEIERPGLSNVASTVLFLMGYKAPADYDPPLVVKA